MNQTKFQSLVESLINLLIGYGVAIATQVGVFPLFGIHIPLHDNFVMGGIFTVVSLVRSYLIRRWFNRGFIFKKPVQEAIPREKKVVAGKLLRHEKAYLEKLITHTIDKCQGRPCCVHNPSNHKMRKWKLNYRFDKGVMERICPDHGVGHPDPDDAAFWESIGKPEMSVHGCCGCCERMKS